MLRRSPKHRDLTIHARAGETEIHYTESPAHSDNDAPKELDQGEGQTAPTLMREVRQSVHTDTPAPSPRVSIILRRTVRTEETTEADISCCCCPWLRRKS